MPKRIAQWNPARGVWETGMENLLCGHSELYSETFPTSGMTRNGVVYEQPTPEPHTGVIESSLLRTPVADETGGGPLHPDTAKARGQTLRLTGQILAHTGHLLPTPNTSSGTGPGEHGTGGPNLQTALALLPTPAAMNPNDGEGFDTWEARWQKVKATGKNGNGFGTPLAIAVQLIGDSTSPLSAAGSTSPVDLPPPLLDLMDETDSTA